MNEKWNFFHLADFVTRTKQKLKSQKPNRINEQTEERVWKRTKKISTRKQNWSDLHLLHAFVIYSISYYLWINFKCSKCFFHRRRGHQTIVAVKFIAQLFFSLSCASWFLVFSVFQISFWPHNRLSLKVKRFQFFSVFLFIVLTLRSQFIIYFWIIFFDCFVATIEQQKNMNI